MQKFRNKEINEIGKTRDFAAWEGA